MQRFEEHGILLAIASISEPIKEGTQFITSNHHDIQVGTWKYSAGKKLNSHYHKDNERSITRTQEFIYVKKGKIKCLVYSLDSFLINSFELSEGDYATFFNGGHGYEFIEDSEVIEVKVGEFNYDDKVRI